MSNRKRRAEIKKLKENIPTMTMKEVIKRGDLPEHFHLFTLQEMKEYNSRKNEKRREVFKKRLTEYDFIDKNEWW